MTGLLDLAHDAEWGAERSRFADLLQQQQATWEAGTSAWAVVPDNHGQRFFMVAEDLEGQRRGAEVVNGFIGPATFSWGIGFVRPNLPPALSRVHGLFALAREVVPTADREHFLRDLEELVTVAAQRPRRSEFVGVRYVDLLRDFRLCLANLQADQAEALLERIRVSGELSKENLRFLQIEFLGRFDRWSEIRNLPTLPGILEARRPRAINEILLQMVWFAELSQRLAMGQPALQVMQIERIGERYGRVLGALDCPTTPEGRRVKGLHLKALDAALFRDFLATLGESEREELSALAEGPRTDQAAKGSAEQNPLDEALRLRHQGRFRQVLELFAERMDIELGLVAMEAALELEDAEAAAAIAAIVRPRFDAGDVQLARRDARDLAELESLASGRCASWLDWTRRLAGSAEWPEATRVLRAAVESWPPLDSMSSAEILEISENLLAGATGINESHVASTLDHWCVALVGSAADPALSPLSTTVLEVLANQNAVSDAVRYSFLRLLDASLAAAPGMERYTQFLASARQLIRTADFVGGIDWCLSLTEVLIESPSPDTAGRDQLLRELATQIAVFGDAMSHRQQEEAAELAMRLGMDGLVRVRAESAEETSHWEGLNGRVVGLYSLLPAAAERLAERLARFCSPREVVGNADMTATDDLKHLAQRADFMIVDTWHAAHQATGAIDAVRAKAHQILPRGRGVSSFLRALDEALQA